MDEHEEPLAGGNASGLVVRVGDTVRKPWTTATEGVVELLRTVRAAGVDAPEPRGSDDAGRLVLEFVPGALVQDGPPLTPGELSRVGAMVRRIHDASEGFVPSGRPGWTTAIPSPGEDLICHNDLAPWNLVRGDRWVFIDWDAAGPSTRLWDLAYAAQAFTLLDVGMEPREAGAQLAAFVDGYGADPGLRAALPAAIAARSAAMHELLRSSTESGRQPWALMHDDGHGAFWAAATRYAEEHQAVWADALRSG